MRRSLITLIILLISVWIGIKLAADPGYLLLAYGEWTLEMPLWLGIVSLLVTFFVLYTLLRLFRNVQRLPNKIRKWSDRHHQRIIQKFTQRGLLALANGEWDAARKRLIKAAKHNKLGWVNYLASAFASHEQQKFDLRDFYLGKALESTSDAQIAVGVVQAHCQLQQQQYEQARVILQRLQQLSPNHIYVLRLLARVNHELGDWRELANLLPKVREYKALPNDQLVLLEIEVYQKYLLNPNQFSNRQILEENWQQIPRALRQNPSLIACYAQLLAQHNAADIAEKIVRKNLLKNWHDGLVLAYGLIKSSYLDWQLATTEKWLPEHQDSAALLLTLGRLSFNNQLWGKARDYWKASVAIKPCPQTYLALGQLLEQLGDQCGAMDCYKQAANLKI